MASPAADFDDLREKIDEIFERRNGAMICHNQCLVFKRLVDVTAEHVQLHWFPHFRENTEFPGQILRVLSRGLQLLKQCGDTEIGSPSAPLIILGSEGEFCDIIDDIKGSCQMMHNYILKSDSIQDSVKEHLVDEFQNKLESVLIIRRSEVEFSSALLDAYEQDKKALMENAGNTSSCSCISLLLTLVAPKIFFSSETIDISLNLLDNAVIPSIPHGDLSRMEIMGEGGYGYVQEARWWKVIPVAIKEFNSEDGFEVEYKLFMKLLTLRSPHIVQILGQSVNQDSKKKCLVMELMDMDLNKFMKKTIPVGESIDIMVQIAKAMKVLHKNNVIHRDLKPSNILVTIRKDGSLIVKLADFGVSKPNFRTRDTQMHTKQGTVAYMAPEMLQVDNDTGGMYSRKVDLYSFGIICAEILTGKQPIAINGQMPGWSSQDIPYDLQRLVNSCLELNPHNRPSFKEILKDLWVVKENYIEQKIIELKSRRLAKAQLLVAKDAVISNLTNGLSIATQISNFFDSLLNTASVNFGSSVKLDEVQKYARKLQRNVQELRINIQLHEHFNWRKWMIEEAMGKLYEEASNFKNNPEHIGRDLDCLVNTLQCLNNDVYQKRVFEYQKQTLKQVVDVLEGKEEVLNFLNIGKSGIRVLCIVGMGGIGKTTMMNALLQRIILEETELAIAKVEIGKEPNKPLHKIRQGILYELGVGSRTGDSHSLEMCFKILKEDKKGLCLCVDDVWTTEQLSELFNENIYGHLPSPSYLILTTRSSEVAESFKETFTKNEEQNCKFYNLQKLPLEKAKFVFRQILKSKVDYLDDELVEAIVSLCDGLPLALQVYANLFKNHPSKRQEWKWIEHKEAHNSSSKAGYDAYNQEEVVLRNLETSIDFQDSEVVEAFVDAMLLWHNKSYEEAAYALSRNGYQSCLNSLYKDSIIEKGEGEVLKCHDLFLFIARKKAQEKGWRYLADNKQVVSSTHGERLKVRGISFDGAMKIEELNNFDLSKLCFLDAMLMATPTSFHSSKIDAFDNLKVLNITLLKDENVDAQNIKLKNLLLPTKLNILYFKDQNYDSQFPESISMLNSLRLLHLNGNWKQLPDSIGISSLQSLYLNNCRGLITFPESIGRLSSLRLLTLDHCDGLVALPESISRLSSLRSLTLDHCDGLVALPESISQLSSLQFLCLKFCSGLAALPKSIGELPSLQSLNLNCLIKLTSLPESIGRLSTLQSLCLDDCYGIVVLPDSIGGLASLQSLRLKSCIGLTTLPISTGELSSLQSLNLSFCHALVALPESIGGLFSLQSLSLSGCQGLASLPESIGMLSSLQHLWLSNCYRLSALPESIGTLSSLQFLHLKFCNNLEALPQSMNRLSSLQVLHLDVGLRGPSIPESIRGISLQSLYLYNRGEIATLPILPKSINVFQFPWTH